MNRLLLGRVLEQEGASRRLRRERPRGARAAPRAGNRSRPARHRDARARRLRPCSSELKDDPHSSDLPVIMTSTLDEPSVVKRCIEMGAEDYLPKPFDPVLLRARIDAGLRRSACMSWNAIGCVTCSRGSFPRPSSRSCSSRPKGSPRLGGVRLTGTVLFLRSARLHHVRRQDPRRDRDRGAQPATSRR